MADFAGSRRRPYAGRAADEKATTTPLIVERNDAGSTAAT